MPPQFLLLIPTALLILLAALRRRRLLVVMNAAVLVVCIPTLLGFNLPGGASRTLVGIPVRVMSYNIRQGRNGIAGVAETIKRQNGAQVRPAAVEPGQIGERAAS